MATASARSILLPSRHFPNPLLLLKNPFPRTLKRSPFRSQFPSLSLSLSLHQHSHPISHTSSNFSIPITTNFIFFGLDHRRTTSSSSSSSSNWSYASSQTLNNNGNVSFNDPPEVAVVLLGWLGSKQKHLRRYAEWYNDRGIHAVTFVAAVMDVLSLDLEERIGGLSRELDSWLSSSSGRYLIVHTFSNTGWLAYGAILDHWRGRQDLFHKIKGCVVDSGGDPNIHPKVWAAGFTTALLKKNSSATYASTEGGGRTPLESGINGSNMEEKKPILIESWLLFTFEKLFSYFLNLPDINKRLTKIISALTMNQPTCPQLYLYSTGDKVIPFQAVESFIEDQRRNGKQIFSYNFGSSPHVDHYRTFPDLYSSQLHNFLKECLVMVGKL